MIEPLFFDTDGVSAFLWIGNESLLSRLFPGRIVIPAQVYAELSNPSVPHLKQRMDVMIQSGAATVMEIESNTESYSLYTKLSSHPDPNHKIIGRGEAAAITLAKLHNGILASNNLKDIAVYVEEYHLKNMTTAYILREAYDKGIIDEAAGNLIWASMLAKRRKLGYSSFSDFLKSLT